MRAPRGCGSLTEEFQPPDPGYRTHQAARLVEHGHRALQVPAHRVHRDLTSFAARMDRCPEAESQ